MGPAVDVTVAAIIQREGRYLLVEERANGAVVFNQPAGHVEPGESLTEAVIRETREETGFAFEPSFLVGIYLWQAPDSGASFLRIAFCGRVQPPTRTPRLDDGILATHWLTTAEVLARQPRLRSPMVMRCINDHQSGAHYPLSCLSDLRTRVLRKAVESGR